MVKKSEIPVEVPAEVQALGPRAIQAFFNSLEDGDSPKMAEMLACKQPPGLVTDTSVTTTHGTLRQQLGDSDAEVKCCMEACKAQGFTPSDNQVYVPTLAKFRFDKDAFLPKENYRQAVKDACAKRGVATHSEVNLSKPVRKKKAPAA